MNRLKILVGNSSDKLGNKICDVLDCKPIKAKFLNFPNREVSCEILESVRGEDVFVVQSMCNSEQFSPNDNFMKLLVMIDALRRSSAKSITAVIPHFGYARQDRQVIPRTPITSRLVADMLQGAGVEKVITVDIHSTQSAGFFTIPVANLYAAKFLAAHLKRMNLNDDIVIVSPDAGGAARARYFAKRFNTDIALIDKRRSKSNQAEALHVVGNVEDKVCIIFDDMIDTAGTLIEGVRALKANGAKTVLAAATHGIFSGPAFSRISECEEIDKIIVTNSIEGEPHEKIEVVSIADLLAKAIKRSHEGGSVSSIY